MKTKQLLLLLIIVFSAFINKAYADNKYVVKVRSTLNVRDGIDGNSRIIGSLFDKDTITALYTYSNGWTSIKYNGDIGYVRSEYLSLIDTGSSDQTYSKDKSSSQNEGFYEGVFKKFKTHDSSPCFIAIIFWIISAVLYFIIPEKTKHGHRWFYTIAVFFLLTFIFEAIYFVTYNRDKTWFTSPKEVGWICAILFFFLFILATYMQSMASIQFLKILDHLGGRNVNYNLGLYCIPVAIVFALTDALFCDNKFADVVITGFLLCILIQTFILINKAVKSGSKPLNIIFSVVFLITGLIATGLMITYLVITVLIVAIICFFIFCGLALLSGGGSKRSSKYDRICGRCRYYNNGHCNRHDIDVSYESVCDDFDS